MMTTTPATEPQREDEGTHAIEGPAARALAEAEARRRQSNLDPVAKPAEINGRPGPEPVRYGDWENKGIASDF